MASETLICEILLHSKSSFTLEDMMRILWPQSQYADTLEMKRWLAVLGPELASRWVSELANSIERRKISSGIRLKAIIVLRFFGTCLFRGLLDIF